MSAAADPGVRTLITPEGVDLRVRLGTAGERAAALMLDVAILFGMSIALTLLAGGVLVATGVQRSGEIAAIIWLVGAFALRNFYFAFFECSPRAATPGKRVMGLRVAARDGGALRVDAVVARNAAREIELYLPMGFLVTGGSDIGAVIVLCGVVWCAVFVLFPLFNRDRLRLGDIIAGTWVLKAPKQMLLPDMAETRAADAGFGFSATQLGAYGVKELQVLESVLRSAEAAAMEAVATRIRHKIDWRRSPGELDSEFLQAYYAALRRHLEQRLLFGVRKRDKHDQV